MSKEVDALYKKVNEEIHRLTTFLRNNKSFDPNKVWGYGHLGNHIAYRYSDVSNEFLLFRLPKKASVDPVDIQIYYINHTENKVNIGIGHRNGSAEIWLTLLCHRGEFDIGLIERHMMEIST